MGLRSGLKSIGRGIGRGVKRAGRWVGDEVGRVVAPIGSAVTGDWKGAASDLGRLGKRIGQGAALLGKEKVGGINVDLLGAAGGAIEGGLGPSQVAQDYFGDTGGGGWAGAAGGAAKGYGGVKGAQALHNIGESFGINKRLGAFSDKVGITSPDPSVRLEGETDEAFVDRVQLRKYDEQMNRQYGTDYEWDSSLSAEQNIDNKRFAQMRGDIVGAYNVRMQDPRTLIIGEQGFGGRHGPGDLSPGSAGSNFIDKAIGEESARVNANMENVLDINPETGQPLLRGLPAAPGALGLPSDLSIATPQIPRNVVPGMAMADPGRLGPGGLPFTPAAIPMTATPDIQPWENPGIAYPNPYANIGNATTTTPETIPDDKKWWQRGLDYVGEHPDTLVSTVGAMTEGSGEDDYYNRRAAVDERMMDLRERQAAYEQDKERLREQFALSQRSRWA